MISQIFDKNITLSCMDLGANLESLCRKPYVSCKFKNLNENLYIYVYILKLNKYLYLINRQKSYFFEFRRRKFGLLNLASKKRIGNMKTIGFTPNFLLTILVFNWTQRSEKIVSFQTENNYRFLDKSDVIGTRLKMPCPIDKGTSNFFVWSWMNETSLVFWLNVFSNCGFFETVTCGFVQERHSKNLSDF